MSLNSSPPRAWSPLVIAAYLAPAVPVLALILSVNLPFVNSGGLWFGVPALFVWTAVWVLLLTPALWFTDRVLHGDHTEEDEQ